MVLQDGVTGYLVGLPPEALPPVRARDLSAAWDAARGAADAARWDVPRLFRFRRTPEDAGEAADHGIEMALADPDACCWAGAVDRTLGLASTYGISVCLRLLALVDLLGSAPWTTSWFALRRDGAEISPPLLNAAAAAPLTTQGGLDEAVVLARLPRGSTVRQTPPPRLLPSGAPA